jgi:small neutral amino acid transporter SnatA (MarC family)
MEKLKRKLHVILALVMLLSGWGIWGMLKTAFPETYFSWYPMIPGFFYIMGLVFIAVITRDYKENQRKLVNLYMIIKLCKVAASLLLGSIYLIFIKIQIRDFSVVFIGFYLLYLGIETYFFYLAEEVIKKKKVNE